MSLKLQHPLRSAATISASVTWSDWPSRNFAMMPSSMSAQASIIFSRISAHLALRSAGISIHSYFCLRLFVEDGGLHGDEIDHALVLIFLADRPLDGHRVDSEARLERRDVHREVGADLVHLVDEHDARHLVLVGLAPHRLGLRLHAVAAVEDGHRAVEHAERALDLDGEVDVSRRVDDVDVMLGMVVLHPFPEAGRGRRRDGDAALALLLHPVHDGRAVVHLADLG